MAKIFISYRRNDSSGYSGRLAERLHAAFGAANVFMDLDDIKPGVDFTAELHSAVGKCTALLALIGPHWLNATDATGARRIDDEQDFVRQEISAALQRQIRVIPLLLQRAEMPTAADLPEPLAPLALHQAMELSDSRWDYDVDQLIKALGGRVSGRTAVRRIWPLAAGASALVALAVAGVTYFRAPPSMPGTSDYQPRPPASDATPAGREPAAGNPVTMPAAQPDLSGNWLGQWTTDTGEVVKIYFHFESSGDKLMGNVRYPTGEGGIWDGKIDGDRILFSSRHTPQFEDNEVSISYAGRLNGDSIDLIMQRPEGVGRFVAYRQPAS
jgi:hypothetical protein